MIAKSSSHDQGDHHAHILFLQNMQVDLHETWYVAFRTLAHCSLIKGDLDLFYSKVNFGNICFYMGKSENNGYF